MSWTGIFLHATLMLCGMTDVADSNVCVDYYTPVEGTPIKSVEANVSTWPAIDQLCKNAYFSYNMAQRSAFWNDPIRSQVAVLCDNALGGVLPLRMKKAINRSVYWINDYGIEDEKLTEEELAVIDPAALNGPNFFGGVVRKETFAMTFVSRTHEFNCTLCEILRRKSLQTPFGPPPPSSDTIVTYWVYVNAVAESPVATVRSDLALALNVPLSAIAHEYTQSPQTTSESTTPTSSTITTTRTTTTPTTATTTPTTATTTRTSVTTTPTTVTTTPTTVTTTPTTVTTTAPTLTTTTTVKSSEAPADATTLTTTYGIEATIESPAKTQKSIIPLNAYLDATTLTEDVNGYVKEGLASSSSEEEDSSSSSTTTSTTSSTIPTEETFETSPQTSSSIHVPTEGSSTLETGREEQVYRITRTNADLLLPHVYDVLTPEYFTITRIDGNHYCVGEAIDDGFGNRHYWPDTKPGVVVVKRNKKNDASTLTSRECTYNLQGIALWTEPVVWFETWKNCSSPITPGGDDEETLDNASEYLNNLTAEPVLSRQLEDIADVVNAVLLLDEQVLTNNDNRTMQIVQDLETIVSNMVIEAGDVVNSTQSNLALVVSDVQSSTDTLVGITISTVDDSGDLVLELVRSSTQVNITNQTQVRTVLSPEMVRRHTRLAFMVFPDGKLFPSRRGSKYKANSHVINIILVNANLSTHNLENEYIEIAFQPFADVPDKNSLCGYWDFTTDNWETSGCTMLNTSDSHLDVCKCSHLTNFAEIITGGSRVTGANARALDIISLVGCTFSMSALLAIALTAILFEHWRRELSNKILLHMSAAIALNLIAFFLVASVRPPPDSVGCIVIGVLLHYSVLTCFFWMLVMSTLQLLRLVTMMGAKAIPNLLLKTTLFAWGIPLLPIIVCLCIDPHIYTINTGTSLNRDFCYPQGTAFSVTVLAPVVVVVATNIVVFVVIMFRIHSWCGWGKLETLERHGLTDRNIAMRRFNTTVLLFFLFGLTWTFGLFSANIVFAYLFCITATMQGFVLFVFLVLLERKTSGYWKTAIADISNKNRSSDNSHSGSKISETSFKSLPFTK